MAERSIVVRLRADVAGFKAGMASAKKSVDDLAKADVKRPAQAFQSMADGAALAGAAVALGVGKAIAAFADFDQEMSAAAAATGATGQELSALRDAAMKAGEDTKFSATEAAQGITEMAKAGVSAADILNGGLNGALDLAAAGQLGVGRAAEIAATALNQFNLSGQDVAHVADLYAAAAGNAQGSVDDVANAMKYAGVTANSMGVSIEETTGVIGLFASKGIIGEQAGTTFRSMLMSLTSPSKIAAKAMGDLGINVYDASGKFVGMEGAAEILNKKLGPLDEATRNAALGQIFGNEAMGGAIALYQGGGAAVADWTSKVNDAGFAQEQAAKLMDNLKGDFEQLSGSLETVFIKSGSGANDALRSLTQGLTGFVNALGGVPGPVLLAGGAVTALLLGLPKGITMWQDYTARLDAVAQSAPRAVGALRALGTVTAGLAVGAVAVGAVGAALQQLGYATESIDTTKLVADLSNGTGAVEAFDKSIRGVAGGNAFGEASDKVSSFGDVVSATFNPSTYEGIDAMAGKFNSLFGIENTSAMGTAAKRLGEVDAALAQMVTSGNVTGAYQSFQELSRAAAAQGVTVDQLKEKLPQYAAAAQAAASTAQAVAPQVDVYAQELKTTEDNARKAKDALDSLKTSILGLGSPLVEQRQAEAAYAAAVDAATKSVKDNGRTLDVHSEKGRANRATLDTLRQTTLTAASATFTLTNDTKLAAAAVQRGREEFIRQAGQMGLNRTQAGLLADSYGLIPDQVTTLINTSGVPTTTAQLDGVTGKMNVLDQKRATPGVSARVDNGSFNYADWRLDQVARNRTATITVRTLSVSMPGVAMPGAVAPGNPYFLRRARGGPVRGVGSETSDSIPTLLSDNEHVVAADEVRGFGGHAALERMRAEARAGMVRRAAGGPVVSSRAADVVVSSRSGAGSVVAVLADSDRALLRAVADRPVEVRADLQVDGRQAGVIVASGAASNRRGGRGG